MILVTGGFGFIGSNLVNALCDIDKDVIICDYNKVLNKDYFSSFRKIKACIQPDKILDFIELNNVEIIPSDCWKRCELFGIDPYPGKEKSIFIWSSLLP